MKYLQDFLEVYLDPTWQPIQEHESIAVGSERDLHNKFQQRIGVDQRSEAKAIALEISYKLTTAPWMVAFRSQV